VADLTDDHFCSGQQGPSTDRPRIRSTTSCYKPNCEQLKSESNFLKSKDVRSTIAMIGGGERKGRVWGREGPERNDGGPLHYIVVAIGAFCLKSATAQCLCIRHSRGKSGPALGGTEYRLMGYIESAEQSRTAERNKISKLTVKLQIILTEHDCRM